MTSVYTQHATETKTAQTKRLPGRKDQVVNSEGGFVFAVSPWDRLNRFLILGSEGGSYYATERDLTLENFDTLTELVREDGIRVVETIREIDAENRAPKKAPSLFALAYAAKKGAIDTRKAAFDAALQIVRTGTDLFSFVDTLTKFGGWGPAQRKFVQRWYEQKGAQGAEYQILKYQQRDGWSHGDVLRLAHPKFNVPFMDPLARYALGATQGERTVGTDGERTYGATAGLSERVQAIESLKTESDTAKVIAAIEQHGLTREMIPTQYLGKAEVLEALLERMPMTAMIRNLGSMTAKGLLVPMAEATSTVVDRLTDAEILRKARIHPAVVLGALAIYRQGHGFRGNLTWQVNPSIMDALDKAFYLSFGNVEPAGKRTYLAVDISSSMTSGTVAGITGLRPVDGAAALAMVTARTESNYIIRGFSSSGGGGWYGGGGTLMKELGLTASDSLSAALNAVQGAFGRTDCSLPMQDALKTNLQVDTFVVLTDSETYAGNQHPVQALDAYKQKSGIDARVIVVGMVGNNFTIADPTRTDMLDVVGFDTGALRVMRDFSSGSF